MRFLLAAPIAVMFLFSICMCVFSSVLLSLKHMPSSSSAISLSPAVCDAELADDSLASLMHDLRNFGREPKLRKGNDSEATTERKLAKRLRNARNTGRFTALQEAELKTIAGDAPQLAEEDTVTSLMQDLRSFGREPKHRRGNDPEATTERNLASRLRNARNAGRLTADHQSELTTLKQQELGVLQEASLPPDPADPFAEEAENRVEQDLLTMTNGIR